MTQQIPQPPRVLVVLKVARISPQIEVTPTLSLEFSAGRYTKDQNTPLMALVPVAPKLEVEDRDAEIEGTSQESTEENEPEMTGGNQFTGGARVSHLL